MFERFTDRARRVLVLAQEEARLLNHSFIGTEHLLLGLIHEGEGVAAKTLATFHVDLEYVRHEIEAGTDNPSGSPPFTPRAKKVLELALREALQLGQSYIGTEHMLLGLIREGEGVAASILIGKGINLGELRVGVLDMMTHGARNEEKWRGHTIRPPEELPEAIPEVEPKAVLPTLGLQMSERWLRQLADAIRDGRANLEQVTIELRAWLAHEEARRNLPEYPE